MNKIGFRCLRIVAHNRLSRYVLLPVILCFSGCSQIACDDEITQRIYQGMSVRIDSTVPDAPTKARTISLNGIPVCPPFKAMQQMSQPPVEGIVRPGENTILVDGDFEEGEQIGFIIFLREQSKIPGAIDSKEIGRVLIKGEDIGKPVKVQFDTCIGLERQRRLFFVDQFDDIGTFSNEDKKAIHSILNQLASVYTRMNSGDNSSEIFDQLLHLKRFPFQVRLLLSGEQEDANQTDPRQFIFSSRYRIDGLVFGALSLEDTTFIVGEKGVLVYPRSDPYKITDEPYILYAMNLNGASGLIPVEKYFIFVKYNGKWCIFKTYAHASGF